MRVLIAHNRYIFPGGEERHIDLLEGALHECGIETRRFERASSEIPRRLSSRISVAAGMTYRPSSARQLRSVLERWRPDLVHFHNLLPLLTPSTLREARRFGCGVVLTTHNARFACPAGTLLRNGRVHDDCIEGSSLLCGLRNSRGRWDESLAYGLALELQRRLRLLARWVDAYIAPSDYMAQLLVRAGFPRARVTRIYHGVHIPKHVTYGGRYVLYAGRLSREKGISTLLEARRQAPTVPLAIAGDGPLEKAVAQMPNVHYLGLLSAQALEAVRRDAAGAVVPSECHETLPFSALEMFAAGKPVIATCMGGLPEIVSDGVTGYLIPPARPDLLSHSMQMLWTEPEHAATLGRRARAICETKFEIKAQTRRLVHLYNHVAAQARLRAQVGSPGRGSKAPSHASAEPNPAEGEISGSAEFGLSNRPRTAVAHEDRDCA